MDPQLHFKGMEVRKQSHRKDRSKSLRNAVLENTCVNRWGQNYKKNEKKIKKKSQGKKDQKVILYRKTKEKVSDHDFNIETSDCTPRLSSSYVCTRPLAVALMFEVYFFVGPDWTVQ